MKKFKSYRRKDTVEMRPYVFGECMKGILVAALCNPEQDLGMIARYPDNHMEQWYVERKYFLEHYVLVE